MRRLAVAFLVSAAMVCGAAAQTYPSGVGGSGISAGATTTNCSTTQVLFALAGKVSCDSGFTYAGGGGTVTVSAMSASTYTTANYYYASSNGGLFVIGGNANTAWCRFADGIWEASSATAPTCNALGGVMAAEFIGSGAPPALTGSCVVVAGTQTGGAAVGKFAIPAGNCAIATTVILAMPTAPTGWTCDAHDLTTPTSIFDQTGTESTTSVTFTIRAVNAAAADIVKFKCMAY